MQVVYLRLPTGHWVSQWWIYSWQSAQAQKVNIVDVWGHLNLNISLPDSQSQ